MNSGPKDPVRYYLFFEIWIVLQQIFIQIKRFQIYQRLENIPLHPSPDILNLLIVEKHPQKSFVFENHSGKVFPSFHISQKFRQVVLENCLRLLRFTKKLYNKIMTNDFQVPIFASNSAKDARVTADYFQMFQIF
jgi:hypothetical protein